MAIFSGLLSGFGLLALVGGGLLALVTLVVLPWWAVIDCALSRREPGRKLGIVLGMMVTWGIGTVVYALFFARFRLLRIATAIMVVVTGGMFLTSVILLAAGAGLGHDTAKESGRPEEAPIQGLPETIPRREIGAFAAVHLTYGPAGPATAAVARFSGDGLDVASARDTDRTIQQVAFDSSRHRYWATTAHEFGSVDPATGRFTRIDASGAGEFSWPAGVAVDDRSGQVYVATSHVFTRFYRFEPSSSGWTRLPAELRDVPIVGLTFLPADGCLYAVGHQSRDRTLRRIHRFNTEGASLGTVDLHPAIPVTPSGEARTQLQASGRFLVVLASNRVLIVDPVSGDVRVPETK